MISKYLYAVRKASNFEKPGAVIPYTGICEGAVGQLAALYLNATRFYSPYTTIYSIVIKHKNIADNELRHKQ